MHIDGLPIIRHHNRRQPQLQPRLPAIRLEYDHVYRRELARNILHSVVFFNLGLFMLTTILGIAEVLGLFADFATLILGASPTTLNLVGLFMCLVCTFAGLRWYVWSMTQNEPETGDSPYLSD